MPTPEPDPVREAVARARREGRNPLRVLLRDGLITVADLEEYAASLDEPERPTDES